MIFILKLYKSTITLLQLHKSQRYILVRSCNRYRVTSDSKCLVLEHLKLFGKIVTHAWSILRYWLQMMWFSGRNTENCIAWLDKMSLHVCCYPKWYWPGPLLMAWCNLDNLDSYITSCISKRIQCLMWDVITHSCPYFNGGIAKSLLMLEHSWIITKQPLTLGHVRVLHSTVLLRYNFDIQVIIPTSACYFHCSDWQYILVVVWWSIFSTHNFVLTTKKHTRCVSMNQVWWKH